METFAQYMTQRKELSQRLLSYHSRHRGYWVPPGAQVGLLFPFVFPQLPFLCKAAWKLHPRECRCYWEECVLL